MFKKTQHLKKIQVRSFIGGKFEKKHFEKHFVETWFFFGIPVYTRYKFIDSEGFHSTAS